MKRRLVIGLVVTLVLYSSAFLATVRAVHVSRIDQVDGPRAAQFVMYASRTSPTWNTAMHWGFRPFLAICEATGNFAFADRVAEVQVDGAPIVIPIWSVLFPR